MIKFGPAGNPERFYEEGGKSSLEMPKWLAGLGLTAYEYQCGRGVKISNESAQKLGKAAKEHGIALSLHAPYYTNISSNEPERIEKTIGYILQSATAAHHMGATRVVVHMGSAKNITRREAMAISKDTMARALRELEQAGLGHITLCPETMGKLNQMGTLEETLEVCKMDERLLPTIDFGHLNARSVGGLETEEQFAAVLDEIHNQLGQERASTFHVHFSRIEYTKSGEKKHVTFADTEWGPSFSPLAKLLVERKLTPTIICESAGTQADDALAMQNMVQKHEAFSS